MGCHWDCAPCRRSDAIVEGFRESRAEDSHTTNDRRLLIDKPTTKYLFESLVIDKVYDEA